MNSFKKLEILSNHISRCKKCSLHETRKNVVIGRGHYNPYFLFLGEAPGEEEDEQGIPFCGDSGVLLDIMIEYLELQSEEFAIGNIIKCRPPDNRDPKKEEIDICTKLWLKKQIELLDPKVIVTVGRIASAYFLGNKYLTGITKYAGEFFKQPNYDVYPICHPSYFLRHGNKGREEMWKPFLENLVEYIRKCL